MNTQSRSTSLQFNSSQALIKILLYLILLLNAYASTYIIIEKFEKVIAVKLS